MSESCDFEKIKYEKSIDTIKQIFQLAVQIITTLAVINVTILGFAITSKNSSLLFLCSLIMIISIVLHYRIRKWVIPFLVDAIIIEHEKKALFHTAESFLKIFFKTKNVNIIKKRILEFKEDLISTNSSFLEKMMRITIFPNHFGTYFFLWFAAISQIALGIILYKYYNWSFL